jgi:hypothetical protein
MAYTVTSADYRSEDVWGSAKVRIKDVNLGTLSETLVPGDFALAEILGVQKIAGVATFTYNAATKVLVPSATGVLRLLVIGR